MHDTATDVLLTWKSSFYSFLCQKQSKFSCPSLCPRFLIHTFIMVTTSCLTLVSSCCKLLLSSSLAFATCFTCSSVFTCSWRRASSARCATPRARSSSSNAGKESQSAFRSSRRKRGKQREESVSHTCFLWFLFLLLQLVFLSKGLLESGAQLSDLIFFHLQSLVHLTLGFSNDHSLQNNAIVEH